MAKVGRWLHVTDALERDEIACLLFRTIRVHGRLIVRSRARERHIGAKQVSSCCFSCREPCAGCTHETRAAHNGPMALRRLADVSSQPRKVTAMLAFCPAKGSPLSPSECRP